MMKTISIFIILLVFSVTSFVISSDKVEDKSLDQILASLKMEKIQAEMIAETMEKRGKLTTKEVSRIKRDIASVKDENINAVKAEALERLSSKNSFATK